MRWIIYWLAVIVFTAYPIGLLIVIFAWAAPETFDRLFRRHSSRRRPRI